MTTDYCIAYSLHDNQHTKNSTNSCRKGRAGFSASSLLSSVGNNNSPGLTDLSSLGVMSQEKLSNMETGGEGSHTPSLGVISQEKLSTNMGGGESHTPSHVLPHVDSGK